MPEREDARDVLVTRDQQRTRRTASRRARVGTGSLRRRAQLLHCRADLSVIADPRQYRYAAEETRRGEVDALVMAAAGLKRIGRADRIGEYLADEICVSAVAQGALGHRSSRDDGNVRELLAFLHDPATCAEVSAERALLARLGGGCHVPIGARARVAGEQVSSDRRGRQSGWQRALPRRDFWIRHGSRPSWASV